jgi:hypothetical protein
MAKGKDIWVPYYFRINGMKVFKNFIKDIYIHYTAIGTIKATEPVAEPGQTAN